MSAKNHVKAVALVLAAMIGTFGGALAAPDTPPPDAAHDSPLDEGLRRYPPTETNSAALDAERLAARLGIDLVPGDVKDRAHPDGWDILRFQKAQEAIRKWIDREVARASNEIAAPPPEAALFLSSRADALAALRKGVLRGEPPVWAERLDVRSRARQPRLIGIIYLQYVLVADALDARRTGREAVALEDLETSWRLNEAVGRSPFVVSRGISIVVTRWQVGALRRLARVPAMWRDRLSCLDPVGSMLEVLRLEASLWPVTESEISVRGPFAGVRGAALSAYARWCLKDASREYQEALDRSARLRPYCDGRVEEEAFSETLPWWNRFEGPFLNGITVYLPRASRLAFDIEMTLKILDLRQARDDDHGDWPASYPRIEISEVCPEDHWIYERTPGGGMSLAFSRAPRWTNAMGNILGVVLPARYESGASGGLR